MHLNELLESIKRHSNPTEAINRLGKVLHEHENNLVDKGYNVLKSELSAGMYEAINGPHFDEVNAQRAVEHMENEDGSKGPHWSVEETTNIANQMGINLRSEKHNKWDWYVAMNMIWSDFYKAVVAMTGNTNTKHFAELAKAWICDKDIADGKMWHYYVYIMCNDEDNDYKVLHENSKHKYYDEGHEYHRNYDYPEYEYKRYHDEYPTHRRSYTYDKEYEREQDVLQRQNRNTSIRHF